METNLHEMITISHVIWGQILHKLQAVYEYHKQLGLWETLVIYITVGIKSLRDACSARAHNFSPVFFTFSCKTVQHYVVRIH